MSETLTGLQTEDGMHVVFVLAIEGYPRLIATTGDAALLAALLATGWAGYDWSAILGGLAVTWGDGQQMRPWSSDLSIGSIKFAVQDYDGNDVFGKAVGASAGGTETRLATAMNCAAVSVVVKRADDFDASGEIHIDPECIAYSSRNTGTDTFTVSARGKYSPFLADGANFARPHTLPETDYGVSLAPEVCSQPRTWVGRWCGLWMHRVVGGVPCTRANAELVFAGKIVGTGDDAEGLTWVEADDLKCAIKDTVLLRDQWTAEIKQGMYFQIGWQVSITDGAGGAWSTTNPLKVVAGASGANEVEPGAYSLDEWVDKLNVWLGAELAASRLEHNITAALVQTTDGPRFALLFTHTAVDDQAAFLTGSAKIMEFMGWPVGTTSQEHGPWSGTTYNFLSPMAPLVHSIAPGSAYLFFEGQHGTWFNNGNFLPFGSPDASAGVVQLSTGECLLVTNDLVSELQLWHNADDFLQQLAGKTYDTQADYTVRLGEAEGKITVRQVAVIGGDFAALVMQLLASTGTSHFNGGLNGELTDAGGGEDVYLDVFPEQLGAAIPFELLDTGLVTDLLHLTAGSAPLLLVIEKATKLVEVIGPELTLRAAHFVFRGGGGGDLGAGLRVRSWAMPSAASALFNLTESNKAAPSEQDENQRTTSHDDDRYCCNILKVQYNRSLNGSGDTYGAVDTIVDTGSMQRMGERVWTIKARNSFGGVASSVAAVEQLIAFLAGMMPLFGLPLKVLRRSVDLTMYAGVAPGDQCTVTDSHVRAPTTGERGITGQAGLIIGHQSDYGGHSFSSDVPAPMVAEVEVLTYAKNRTAAYCPTAQVDNGAAGGGYNAGSRTLTFWSHKYSESSQTVDVGRFAALDKVMIIERDPVDPASPQFWETYLDSVNTGANTAVVHDALTGWDSSKHYRMISQNYTDAVATQKVNVYQADDADGMIEDLAQAYEYGWNTNNPATWSNEDPTDNQIELYSVKAYGDGFALDTGYDADLARLANHLANVATSPKMACLTAEMGGHIGLRKILAIYVVHLGPGDLQGYERLLWVEPWLRSTSGTATLRVSLCRNPPIGTSRVLTDEDDPEYILMSPYESNDWTRSSSTYARGTPYGFSLKSISKNTGLGYLVFEGDPTLRTRGPAQASAGWYRP